MKFDLDTRSAIDLIAKAAGCRILEEEENINLIFERSIPDSSIKIDSQVIEKTIENIKLKRVHEETGLYDDFTYEIIVKEETSTFRRFRNKALELTDNVNNIDYELSPASDEYILWLLYNISKESSPRDYRIALSYSRSMTTGFAQENKENLSSFDLIRYFSSRLFSLKIKRKEATSIKDFILLQYSLLFQIGYNLDLALVPQKSIEGMSRRGRINRMRRSKAEELNVPHKVYKEDLIHHYLLAVSTDNPVVEFLSYYHILENFFESVFNDELISKVKDHITHPGFSYKRKKDLKGLIKIILFPKWLLLKNLPTCRL